MAKTWAWGRKKTAFYDTLAENGSAKEVMKSDTLRLMARELPR